jgi:tRNA A-37 threonylcarbamoyl transferase component Bud32
MESNVPTPKLLYQGQEDKKRIYIILYERIMDADNLLHIWQNKSSIEELKPLLYSLVMEIATQHVLGLLQKDLHLKNYLVTEKCIYTLDGGQILKFDRPLDEERSLEYLCLLLAQFGVGMNAIQVELYQYYAQLRGWILKSYDVKKFKKILQQKKVERSENFQKKIFRNSSQFKHIEKMTKTITYDRSYTSSDFLHLLETPEKLFADPAAVVLKKGRSSTVVKVMVDGKSFVVKRYNMKNSWHRLRRTLRETRAKKSWRVSQHLFSEGVATAKPVAFIENQFLGFRGPSYFLMEFIEGEHIGAYFRTFQVESINVFQQMAGKIAALMNDLAELKITHGDLKMTNILVCNDKPYLIDLDGIKEHSSEKSLSAELRKEIKRFMRNFENSPSVLALFKPLFYEKNPQ